MTTFAVMSGNIVSNVILADEQQAAEQALGVTLIEITSFIKSRRIV